MRRLYLLITVITCFSFFTIPAQTRATAVESADPKMVAAGINLYEEHCADCHRPFQKTNKPQRRLSRLRSSIEQMASMNSLKFLDDEQLEAIAAALATKSF